MTETRLTVERWSRTSMTTAVALALLVAGLALVPLALSANNTNNLTTLFVYVILATMWNALAGYAGLVSVGQQAFIGLGAYAVIRLAHEGVGVYPALVIGALLAGALAIPLSFVMLQLSGGEFAIGMWVVAEVCLGLVILDHSIKGLTGISLIEINAYSPREQRDYNYWIALASAVVLLGVIFLLLRSRVGASLQAIRDDEVAAASVGVRVLLGKGIVFVIAAIGCAMAGTLWLATNITYQPRAYFGVEWTAYMVFMVLVGGLGTFEGPIIGAVVFFVIDQEFGTANYGVWYLVGLGATAVVFALFLPRGIWGTIEDRFGLQLLPVGYRVAGLARGRVREHAESGSGQPT